MECGYMMGLFGMYDGNYNITKYLGIISRKNIWGISSHKFKYHKNQDFGQCSEWAYAV